MGENGVGMPAWLLLNQFGRIVYEAFGEWPYLVGSATRTTHWRDVDVRLILEDSQYWLMFGKSSRAGEAHPKWRALCLAFAALGRQMTGLPIDFQIQARTKANELYDGPRWALILCAETVGDTPAGETNAGPNDNGQSLLVNTVPLGKE